MPAPNIAFEGSPQELEAVMSQLQRSPEMAGAFKSARPQAMLGGLNVEDIYNGGTPEQIAAKKQEIQAAQLRMKDFLAEAADKGGKLGLLSVVSQLSENPELAKAISGMDAANRAAYAPKSLGKSIYNQSGMVEDPSFTEKRQDDDWNKKVTLASALEAQTQNRLSREATNALTNATRAEAAQSRQEAARITADAAAARQQDTLDLRKESLTAQQTKNLGDFLSKTKLDSLAASVPEVSAMLAKYPSGKAIPGIGGVDAAMLQNPTMMGLGGNYLMTGEGNGKEAKENASKIANVTDMMLAALAGLNVTGSEQVRAKLRYMKDFGYNSDDFRSAWDEATKLLESARVNAIARSGGLESPAVKRYLDAGGADISRSFLMPKSEEKGQPAAAKAAPALPKGWSALP